MVVGMDAWVPHNWIQFIRCGVWGRQKRSTNDLDRWWHGQGDCTMHDGINVTDLRYSQVACVHSVLSISQHLPLIRSNQPKELKQQREGPNTISSYVFLNVQMSFELPNSCFFKLSNSNSNIWKVQKSRQGFF